MEPVHPLGIELLSSGRAGRGCVLDVLDDEADPPLTSPPRIKSAVSIRRWAHSLNKLGSIEEVIEAKTLRAINRDELPAVLLSLGCFPANQRQASFGAFFAGVSGEPSFQGLSASCCVGRA